MAAWDLVGQGMKWHDQIHDGEEEIHNHVCWAHDGHQFPKKHLLRHHRAKQTPLKIRVTSSTFQNAFRIVGLLKCQVY